MGIGLFNVTACDIISPVLHAIPRVQKEAMISNGETSLSPQKMVDYAGFAVAGLRMQHWWWSGDRFSG